MTSLFIDDMQSRTFMRFADRPVHKLSYRVAHATSPEADFIKPAV